MQISSFFRQCTCGAVSLFLACYLCFPTVLLAYSSATPSKLEASKPDETCTALYYEPDRGSSPHVIEANEMEDTTAFALVPLENEQKALVLAVAEEFSVPAELIFGVMYAESRYTCNVISPDGENYGIMQINRVNFGWLSEKFGSEDFLDFYQNMKSGAYLLSQYHEKYGKSIDKTLMCYRFGEGGANRQWKKGVYTDTYCDLVRGEMARISRA